MDTSLVDKAIQFAVKAHAGAERRGKGFPYIIHPMEAMEIVSTMTADPEMLAAAALHDVVEDTPVTVEDLNREFGPRVAALVEAESDKLIPGMNEEESWRTRKQMAIDRLAGASRDVKIVSLGDKLSNMRAIARDYAVQGDELWKLFHVKEKSAHAWHYRGLEESLSELSGLPAYEEFASLVERVFAGCSTDDFPMKVNLDDYELSGEGANGTSYNHRTNPAIMLKLYNPGKIEQPLSEMRLARKVFAAGIPTPEPGEYVTDGTRYGIRFRRIVGKKSYARAVGDEPERAEEYGASFARLCKKLHQTHLDTSQFTSIKDHYGVLLEKNPFFTPEEKRKLSAWIASVPDTDTAIHGDLQFGNAIFVGDEQYFIDLGDFCYGHPYFDLGMVYLCCCVDEEDFLKEVFHMDKKTAERFWDGFAPAYFGRGLSKNDIKDLLTPFVGLKTLVIERDTGCPMPLFREYLRPIL